MARGNGKQAQTAMRVGKLSAFVTANGGQSNDTKQQEYVDWGEVDGGLLAGTIIAVNKMGGSILLGHTRDKSCYSIVLFYDGAKQNYYFPCSQAGCGDLEVFLYALCDAEKYNGD